MLEQAVGLKRCQSYCISQSHELGCTPKSSSVHEALKFEAVCNFIIPVLNFRTEV
jgi:hypothetical protein